MPTWLIKGAWPDLFFLNDPPLLSMKTASLVSEESLYFSDYRNEIWGLNMFHIDIMNKQVG